MSTVDEMVVKWSMDSAKFDSGVNAMNKQMNLLKSEFKATSINLKNFGTTTDQLKNKQQYLSNAMSIQKEKVSALRQQYEKQKQATGENSTETQNLAIKLNNAVGYYNTLKGQLKDTTEELKNQSSELNNTSQSLESISKKFSSFGGSLSGVGQKLTNSLTTSIKGIGSSAISSYKTVKEGMDNLVKATGATGESAKELEETYKNIASVSSADFSTIGSALGEVNTRFGFLGETAEKCTEQFLKFAKINNTDTVTSVQLVSRAMGDAGISSDKYNEVLDQLTVAAQASGISIDKLTENITKYGAPMRALGLDTKESISIFAAWEKAGVNTEIAFSGMKQAIGAWGKEGKNATEEFKKTLQEIGKCPDIASATAKAIGVFGQKAGPDLADAIKGGRFEYQDFLDLIEKSGGSVENTYNQLADGTEEVTKATNNASIALSEIGSTIITMVAPYLKQLSEKVKEISTWFSGLSDETKKTIVTVAGIVAVVGPTLSAIGRLSTGLGALINGFGALKNSTILANTATKLFTMAQTALNFVLNLNPITLIITSLVALGATLAVLYIKCDTFREGVQKVWAQLKETFSGFSNYLSEVFAIDWTKEFGILGEPINMFFQNIKNYWEGTKQVFNGIIEFVKGVFSGDWGRAWEGVKNIFGGIMKGLSSTFKAPLNAVIALINSAIGGLNKIKVNIPSWVPGVGGKHFGVNIPKMNYLYTGGIISTPTLLNANTVVGDKFKGIGNQAEAVIPLTSMYKEVRNIFRDEITQAQIRELRSSLRESQRAQTQPINVNITLQSDVNMDGRKVGDMVTNRIVENITRQQNSRNISKGRLRRV